MKKSMKDTMMTLPKKQNLAVSKPVEPAHELMPTSMTRVYAEVKKTTSRLTLEIPLDLSKELKILAIEKNITLKDLVMRMLQQGLELQSTGE